MQIVKGLPPPSVPSKILLERYASLPVDLTALPGVKLGKLLGVLASFSEYADYQLALLEGRRDRLENAVESRYAEVSILKDTGLEKWRLESQIIRDDKYRRLKKKLLSVSSKARLVKALRDSYIRNYSAVSREITRRISEIKLSGGHT